MKGRCRVKVNPLLRCLGAIRRAICSAGILQKLQKFGGPSACETDEEMGTKPSARWRSTRGQGMTKQTPPPPSPASPLQAPQKDRSPWEKSGSGCPGRAATIRCDCRLPLPAKGEKRGGQASTRPNWQQHGGVTATSGFC